MKLAQIVLVSTVLLQTALEGNAGNSTIDIRLVDGRYPNQGRVEVNPAGEDVWGSYCSNDHPHPSGRVVCRQLGYPALFSATAIAQFGLGTGPIWFQSVYCNENMITITATSTLDDCLTLRWFPSYTVCDHRFDVGLTCFTGNIRLVGGQKAQEGTVQVHLGGDEWVLLESEVPEFMDPDTICSHLGYHYAIGPTTSTVHETNHNVLCRYGHCHTRGHVRKFFSCIDEVTLHLCSSNVNKTVLGVVCATDEDILPVNPDLKFHLASTSNSSEHTGFIEAQYNGSSWKTVCVKVLRDWQANIIANEACRASGYPWAYTFKLIPYAESSGYSTTGNEFIMRDVFLDGYDELQWMHGEHACSTHHYSLVFVECQKGILQYGLVVWPCPTQTCRDRCGEPATDVQCGCDVLCSHCHDCCYDYNEWCSIQHDTGNDTRIISEKVAAISGSSVCKIVNFHKRSIIINGCSQEWNDTQEAHQCSNDTSSDLVEYVEGVLFKNLYCAQCNGLNASDMNNVNPDIYWVYDINEGLDECSSNMTTSLDIISGCHSYSGYAFTNGNKYKNPHCAHCNFVNISAWDYCPFSATEVQPGYLEILLGRPVEPWFPEMSDLLTEGEMKCYNVHHQLHVLPDVSYNSSGGSLSLYTGPMTQITYCFLTTLGWQNVQLTWPFFLAYLATPKNESSVLTTQFLSNVSDFKVMLDKTVLPSYEKDSSRDWIVRCGVGQVDFIETCETSLNESEQRCTDSEFVTKAEYVRAFNMSGIQIIYIGDGKLIESKFVSFVRTYEYQSLTSSHEDIKVLVCGERFESAECQLPMVNETQTLTTADGDRVLMYNGYRFLQDQVVWLPDDHILICSSIFLTSEKPFINLSEALTILNCVGYSLSMAALLVTFCNYCLFSSLRNIPGRAIMSLTAVLFLAQLLTVTVLDKAENRSFCTAMAILMHFLWLSTFTWMNVLAFDLMRTFSSSQACRSDNKTFLKYSMFAWGVPLLLVTSCIIINFTNGQSIGFQYGGLQSCWVVGKYAMLCAFLAPIICSLVANAVLFGWTVRGVHSSMVAAAMVHADKSKAKKTLREIWIYLKISCVMGFSWIFGCLASFFNYQAIWYIFVILNSLQGVFIFASFGFNLRIRDLWREKLGMKKRSKVTKSQRTSSGLATTTTTVPIISLQEDTKLKNHPKTLNTST